MEGQLSGKITQLEDFVFKKTNQTNSLQNLNQEIREYFNKDNGEMNISEIHKLNDTTPILDINDFETYVSGVQFSAPPLESQTFDRNYYDNIETKIQVPVSAFREEQYTNAPGQLQRDVPISHSQQGNFVPYDHQGGNKLVHTNSGSNENTNSAQKPTVKRFKLDDNNYPKEQNQKPSAVTYQNYIMNESEIGGDRETPNPQINSHDQFFAQFDPQPGHHLDFNFQNIKESDSNFDNITSVSPLLSMPNLPPNSITCPTIPTETEKIENFIQPQSVQTKDVKNHSNEAGNTDLQHIDVNESLEYASQNDQSIMEYVVDENGVLCDQNGFPLVDDNGQVVKLSEENVNYLKTKNLYDEEVIE